MVELAFMCYKEHLNPWFKSHAFPTHVLSSDGRGSRGGQASTTATIIPHSFRIIHLPLSRIHGFFEYRLTRVEA